MALRVQKIYLVGVVLVAVLVAVLVDVWVRLVGLMGVVVVEEPEARASVVLTKMGRKERFVLSGLGILDLSHQLVQDHHK